jgi:hypothetical protein
VTTRVCGFRSVGFVGFWVCDLSNRLGEGENGRKGKRGERREQEKMGEKGKEEERWRKGEREECTVKRVGLNNFLFNPE